VIRHPFSLAAAAGLAVRAAAQVPSFTSDSTMSMSWSEVNGNNNGILEPGESAEIRMSVSFTNQFGVAQFSPPLGTFTSGTILGHGSAFIDINGEGGTLGAFNLNNPRNNGTTGYGVRSGWIFQFGNGSVNASGSGITQIAFYQFPASPKLARTTNPIERVYAFLWTPSSYSNRTITFAAAGFSGAGSTIGAVYLDLDGSVGASVYLVPANLSFGRVSIPVAPAPASAAALALATLARRGRRRP
jgi:hypothetical protein